MLCHAAVCSDQIPAGKCVLIQEVSGLMTRFCSYVLFFVHSQWRKAQGYLPHALCPTPYALSLMPYALLLSISITLAIIVYLVYARVRAGRKKRTALANLERLYRLYGLGNE